jgi:hypothetical protein
MRSTIASDRRSRHGDTRARLLFLTHRIDSLSMTAHQRDASGTKSRIVSQDWLLGYKVDWGVPEFASSERTLSMVAR